MILSADFFCFVSDGPPSSNGMVTYFLTVLLRQAGIALVLVCFQHLSFSLRRLPQIAREAADPKLRQFNHQHDGRGYSKPLSSISVLHN